MRGQWGFLIAPQVPAAGWASRGLGTGISALSPGDSRGLSPCGDSGTMQGHYRCHWRSRHCWSDPGLEAEQGVMEKTSPSSKALTLPPRPPGPQPWPFPTCCLSRATLCTEASAGRGSPPGQPRVRLATVQTGQAPTHLQPGVDATRSPPPSLGPPSLTCIPPQYAVRVPSFWLSSRCPLPWGTDLWVLGRG